MVQRSESFMAEAYRDIRIDYGCLIYSFER